MFSTSTCSHVTPAGWSRSARTLKLHCRFWETVHALAPEQKRVFLQFATGSARVPVWGHALLASGFIPIDRKNRGKAIEQLKKAQEMLARGVNVWISPEGTRKKLPAWRTGFHYVATGAGLPILPAALDFSTRTVRFFPLYHPTERAEDNLAALGALYDARMAYRPEQY